MTTIAYKDGVLAADRLISDGNERYGYATKLGTARDAKGETVLFAGCGDAAMSADFRDWVMKGFAAGESPPSLQVGDSKAWGMIFYETGEMVSFDPGKPPFRSELVKVGTSPMASFGNGSGYALGAMAMGASAAEGVLIACRFDISSGGGIDVVSFRDPTVHRATLLTPT